MKRNYILKSFFTAAVILSSIAYISCSSENSEPVQPVKKKTLEEQIQTGFIDEVLPAATSPCFQGAFYRKAMSSQDYWLGIKGTFVVPTLIDDPNRVNPAKPAQYLDNASIYLGGTSDGQETDIGLTWEVIKDDNGVVSPDRKAFRPFLRRTAYKSEEAALYKNAPAEKRYYWYPGETVTMSVQVINPKKILFIVDGAGKHYEEEFDAAGYQPSFKAVFKRVNAIDQVANEGKPVQATKAKVIGAKWNKVVLFRKVEGKIYEVPMNTKRYTDMRCPSAANFSVAKIETDDSESIDIMGTP
ncbi:hypothetical protein [Flavobacterium sp. 245]|uniref:hypothetical protein n=1 Tax=Flavobacterium sp. 245 TaxID=2512115 RepID=UPI00105C2812|nr:hypothetical protein [Flavobacterium sp. 245]TDO97012.1 hypothetical protein EV145_11032 [Flavobacterium sp. 245]